VLDVQNSPDVSRTVASKALIRPAERMRRKDDVV